MVQQGKIPASKMCFDRKEIGDWVTSQRPSAAASQEREHGSDLKKSLRGRTRSVAVPQPRRLNALGYRCFKVRRGDE